MDITEDDIKTLTSFPKNVGLIDGNPVILVYGPYGFYIKFQDQNVRLTNKVIQQIVKENQVNINDVKSCIEYHQNKKEGQNGNAKIKLKVARKT
jgi:hypothetical protein